MACMPDYSQEYLDGRADAIKDVLDILNKTNKSLQKEFLRYANEAKKARIENDNPQYTYSDDRAIVEMNKRDLIDELIKKITALSSPENSISKAKGVRNIDASGDKTQDTTHKNGAKT